MRKIRGDDLVNPGMAKLGEMREELNIDAPKGGDLRVPIEMWDRSGPQLAATAPSTNTILSRVMGTATGQDLVRYGVGGGLHDVPENIGRPAVTVQEIRRFRALG